MRLSKKRGSLSHMTGDATSRRALVMVAATSARIAAEEVTKNVKNVFDKDD